MTCARALAVAAESLVGCRFRLHGRDPETGLDCIGVLAAALARTGRTVDFPTGYGLRTSRYDQLDDLARGHGFVLAEDAIEPGDVLFVRSGPGQMHLMMAALAPGRMVEAHARLGRVVLSRGGISQPVLTHWRLRPRQEG
jgi:cell wall-associated NlpC family hydrolase